jgi:hypothetical protein
MAGSTEANVIRWLSEVGVRDADGDTAISSLNLTWIIHRYEESINRQLDLTDDELTGATDVRALVEVLDRADGRAGG